MILGIIFCAYGMEKEMIEKSLNPWIKYNEDNKEGHKVIISVTSCSFLGFPSQNNTETLNCLDLYRERHLIDSIFTSEEPISECEARNMPLKRLLELKVDVIVAWDSDEIVNNQEINYLISFLEQDKNSKNYWHRIFYKNLTFNENTFVRGFNPARIFWRDKDLLYLVAYYDDNYVYYSDGWGKIDCRKLENSSIPIENFEPFHFSWINNERSKNKVKYQIEHFGGGNPNACSFKWNEIENKLEFNLDYYKQHNKEIPKLYNIEEKDSLVFES